MFSPAGPLDHLPPAYATPNGRDSSSVDNSTSLGWYPLQMGDVCTWSYVDGMCHVICTSTTRAYVLHMMHMQIVIQNVQYDQHPIFKTLLWHTDLSLMC